MSGICFGPLSNPLKHGGVLAAVTEMTSPGNPGFVAVDGLSETSDWWSNLPGSMPLVLAVRGRRACGAAGIGQSLVGTSQRSADWVAAAGHSTSVPRRTHSGWELAGGDPPARSYPPVRYLLLGTGVDGPAWWSSSGSTSTSTRCRCTLICKSPSAAWRQEGSYGTLGVALCRVSIGS